MRSPTIYSDDQNTSLLSAQHSDEGDSARLRKYRERKLCKLVYKCRVKNIRFMQYYIRISTKMAKDPSTCTDTELVELTMDCLQALGSDYEPSGNSSSSDSSSEHIHKKVKVKKGFLTPMPKSFDRTNPYNQAWCTEQYNPCAQQFGYQRDVLIGGQQHQQWQRLTPQQQHEIFQTQVCGQPSLEMCHEHHQLPPCPVFASKPQYLNQPRFGLRFGILLEALDVLLIPTSFNLRKQFRQQLNHCNNYLAQKSQMKSSLCSHKHLRHLKLPVHQSPLMLHWILNTIQTLSFLMRFALSYHTYNFCASLNVA